MTADLDMQAAVYSAVLRHTWDTGNGWGSSPSPLRGLYVLDRIVDDVGKAYTDASALDDEAQGTPLPASLRTALAQSVEPIAFVSRFLELIDLNSNDTVSVRGNRGLVAFGPILQLTPFQIVPVFFYAGPRWSRLNLYELSERDGKWMVTHFETRVVS